MNHFAPPKPLGPRMLQRSQSGMSPGRASLGDIPVSDLPAPIDLLLPTPLQRRATAPMNGHRPSLTLNVGPRNSPYPSKDASRSLSEGPAAGRVDVNAVTGGTAVAMLGGGDAGGARMHLGGSTAAQDEQYQHQHQHQHQSSGSGSTGGSTGTGGLPITPRSISKIVSLNDLRQLVHRIEAPPSPSPASSSSPVVPVRSGSGIGIGGDDDYEMGMPPGSNNGNGGDVVVAAAGGGAPRGGAGGAWCDGVLDVVSVLGEGASGAVEAVQDKRTGGRRFARKTIITHEGPLKQLVRELAFLSGLRHTNVVRFYGAYMSPSNSEVKLMMELCEGRSLAAIGEQIRRRKGRVGEKVARVLAEEVCHLCFPPPLFFFFFF